jgi:hypothetical protein
MKSCVSTPGLAVTCYICCPHVRAAAPRRPFFTVCPSRRNVQSGLPGFSLPYQFDSVQTTKVSVHGAINILGLAKRVKAKILASIELEIPDPPAGHRGVEPPGHACSYPPLVVTTRPR